MIDLISLRKFWLLSLACFLLPLLPVVAQDDDDDDDDAAPAEAAPNNDWPQEREELLKKIQAETVARAKRIVTHEKIVAGIRNGARQFEKELKPELLMERRKFWEKERSKWRKNYELDYPRVDYQSSMNIPEWKHPLRRPTVSLERLRETMEQELTQIFQASFPPKSRAELEALGREKHKMITNVADRPMVKFTIRNGRGLTPEIEGRLRTITPERICVDNHWIPRTDLDELTQALFYEEVNQKFVQDYVDTEIRKYVALKENFVTDWKLFLLPDYYMKGNFIPNNYLSKDKKTKKFIASVRRSDNPKNWISRVEYESKRYNEALSRELKKQRAIVEPEFFKHATQHGCNDNYVFDAENKEWIPVKVLAERQRAKQAAPKENPDQNPDDRPTAP